jgi:hypothetical protein
MSDQRASRGWKVEGRKSHAEMSPEMVALAKKLHRYPVNGRRRSLRVISGELASHGYLTANGKPYAAEAIKRMIEA